METIGKLPAVLKLPPKMSEKLHKKRNVGGKNLFRGLTFWPVRLPAERELQKMAMPLMFGITITFHGEKDT